MHPWRVMENAPTLGEAIADYVNGQPINSSGASSYIIQYADTFGGAMASTAINPWGVRQIYELVAALGSNNRRTV